MLTPERVDLINRILAHQRELSIPVETKTLRVLRMLVTSLLIFTAFQFYKPLASHAPPIVNLLVEVVLGIGAAYLVSQVWPIARWVPPSLQVIFGFIVLSVMVSVYAAVGIMMSPSKPKRAGREQLSLTETFKRMKRGDLTRFKAGDHPTEASGWKIMLNPGEGTYRKVTLEEALQACQAEGLRVPSSREEILALTPRPSVSHTLSFWTTSGQAYQYSGGEAETMGVFHTGSRDSTNELLCLK